MAGGGVVADTDENKTWHACKSGLNQNSIDCLVALQPPDNSQLTVLMSKWHMLLCTTAATKRLEQTKAVAAAALPGGV